MVRTTLTPLVALVLATTLVACGGAEEPGAPLAASPTSEATEASEPDPSPSATPEAEPTPSPLPPESSPTPEATEDASPAPTFETACAGREDEAFIEVLTPQPDTTTSSPLLVTGCGNTFEANVVFEVVAEDGTVLANGFDTMTCGNGCVGEFDLEIEVTATGPVTLRLYEVSAADGSVQNLVEVPLTLT